jgi:thiol-disulfide isomerase/thioredoxin
MNRFLLSALIFIAIPALGIAQTASKNPQPKTLAKKPQPLDIKVHVAGLHSGNLYLENHVGDRQAMQDTVKIDSNGNAEFKRDTAMPGGIYLIVLPSKKYFEIVVADEQKFSIETDTVDLIRDTKIKGSKENQYFYEYLNYLSDRQKELEQVQAQIKMTKNKDSLAKYQQRSIAIDSTVKVYKRAYYTTKHPETFMAEVLRAMDEPDAIPFNKLPLKADGTLDSAYNYRNYKAHYWDGMNFCDGRLLRTPVYANKMKFYLDKLTPQTPDSIDAALDWLIEKTRCSPELFQYTVAVNTSKYEISKVMGFDAVFVHLVNKYYATNQVWWVGQDQLTKIVNRGRQLDYCLIGRTAQNMMLKDSAGKITPLTSITAKYSVIIFWDPTCSHCKKEVPILKAYQDSLRKAGISMEVYAIYSELDYKSWRDYIKANNLTWVNVCAQNETELATAKYYFDVYSTPTIYVTDENKVIFGKRLDVDGLKSVLNTRINQDKKKGK